MKRNKKKIKDQHEKDYLYALAHVDFFSRTWIFFPERETSVTLLRSHATRAISARDERGNSMERA